jgi:MoxR-like ATPase
MSDAQRPDETAGVHEGGAEEARLAIEQVQGAYSRLVEEVHKVVVGQDEVVEQLLMSLFCRGHALVVGVPGLAKTLLISTLAETLSLQFSRIQFTPDLMPSDITGTEVIEEDRTTGERALRFVKGPVFANVILADEINRTPPKTQAALLEAMQEQQVTAGGMRHELPSPFFVLATQNPIEQEGTYPLPEAQLDRFMFNITIGYPTEAEEMEVIRRTTAGVRKTLSPIMEAEDVERVQEIVRATPVPDHVMAYALRLVRATRVREHSAEDPKPEIVRDYLAWGAGPRASQNLVMGAKASAILSGRLHASVEDVRRVARPVLRHRIVTNFNAEADGVSTDDVVSKLIDETPTDSATDLERRQMNAAMNG